MAEVNQISPGSQTVSVQVENQQQQSLSNKEICLKNLNKHTLLYNDKVNDRLIYIFDYSVAVIKTDENKTIDLNMTSLTYLKANKEWDLFKHPYILNYLNEILLCTALLYITHIILHLIYLVLLYLYMGTKNVVCACSCITFLIIFILIAILKCRLKADRINKDKCCNLSFRCISLGAFTFGTYFSAFIWIALSLKSKESKLEEDNLWWLQIIVVATSWIQCLFIHKKSPLGLYILMLTKIFRSFLKLFFIWITTVVCFAFLFQLVMRRSGVYPWDDNSTEIIALNKTFKSVTKVSVMMIGEIDGSDIIKSREWMASIILILFEIIVIIILMNLMMSLAVDDVSTLRQYAEDTILRLKINYCIETLHLSKFPGFQWILKTPQICNILITTKKDQFSVPKTKLHVKILPDPKFSATTPLSIADATEIHALNNNNVKCKEHTRDELVFHLKALKNDNGFWMKFTVNILQKFIGLKLKDYKVKNCTCNCFEH